MDIQDLFDIEETRRFKLPTSALGEVEITPIDFNLDDFAEMKRSLTKIDSMEARDVAATLLSVAGRRLTTGDGQNEPRRITKEEAAGLTDDELNRFAREFIGRNTDWLLMDPENARVSFKDEDEKQKQITQIPQAKLPKNEGESDFEHLKRVLSFFFDRERKSAERTLGMSAEMLKNLSKRVTPQIEHLISDNFKISNRLNHSLSLRDPASMRSEHQAHLTAQTNKRLDSLVGGFERLQSIVANSSELLQNMNTLGLSLTEKFTASSAEGARQNRRMLWVGILTLIISVILTAVGLILTYKSYRIAADSGVQSKTFNDAIIDQSKLMREAYSASQRSRARDERLSQLIRRQTEILEQMRALDPRDPKMKTLATGLQELNVELEKELAKGSE